MKRRFIKSVCIGLFLATTPPWQRAQTIAPETPVAGFRVTDMHGRSQRFQSLKGKVTVVVFLSTRCPMSNAFNYRRNTLFHDFHGRVRFIFVDSNSNESLEEIRTYSRSVGFDFPVFRDTHGEAADHLGARATTDTFVLDNKGIVRYRGYIEDAPNPARTTKQGLRLAIESVLGGQQVALAQTRPIGCAIRRPLPR